MAPTEAEETALCPGERTPGWMKIAIALIVAVAAALRFYGLRWGIPDNIRAYSYHPDEFFLVGPALLIIARSTFDPGFYNYPSLQIYLSALAIALGTSLGLATSAGGFYLAARFVTALMGVGSVVAAYWAGSMLCGRIAGLVAMSVLCVAPLHVQHSHFATVDVPSTLFVALTLGFSGMILRRYRLQDYVLAGIAVGLSAGTKYNAAMVMLSPITAHFIARGFSIKNLRGVRFWVIPGCAVLAFVISTPGALLRFNDFSRGLLYEARHAVIGHGLVFAGTGNGFAYTVSSSLWWGIGPVLTLAVLASIFWAVIARSRSSLPVLAFIVPYYVLISVSQVRFARYALPMFPAFAVIVGCATAGIWCSRRMRFCGVFIVAFALLFGLTSSIKIDSYFGLADYREAASRWIRSHAEPGSSIGVFDTPWFYSPPLTKTIGFGTLQQRRHATSEAPYDIVVFGDCPTPGCWWRDGAPPRWVIVSDYEIVDALRLRDKKNICKADRKKVDRVLTDLALLRRYYRKRVMFGPTASVYMPHDMRYPVSRVTVYELKR